MIHSAQEFKRLRESEDLEEQRISATSEAPLAVWREVLMTFPELKEWVISNKTIQIEILETLASDPDAKGRSAVARKRKINDQIFELLRGDPDEQVRHALINNTKLSNQMKLKINVEDSEWLKNALQQKVANK